MLDTETGLNMGAAPAALRFEHFPDRLHAFVFRNWHAVQTRRIADVCGATVAQIERVAASMGLGAAQPFAPEHLRRGTITILRRNWHLLPYRQLLQLLDMTADQLDRTLCEDDFLWHKMGLLKPACPPLRYAEPNAEARRRADVIRIAVEPHAAGALPDMTPRFAFVEDLGRPVPGAAPPSPPTSVGTPLRLIYAYFALFGDPLLSPQLDPYPEGLLQRLAALGVNGVWLHVVLRELAPGGASFPEFGVDHEKRLATLGELVARAARHGIRTYLYLNEPRAMPAPFFETRPDMAGATENEMMAMCTSHPQVLAWVADAVRHVFTAVSGLGGVFTITASENLTNCASRGSLDECPRCRQRGADSLIVEVNNVIAGAIHDVSPAARVIAYDWGWSGHGDATDIIERLDPSIEVMSVSEWSIPIEVGGVRSEIGEYAMSVVGPGPRARRHWAVAAGRKMRAVAKVAVNNTWELSAVPCLPVMDLVAEHCRNLTEAGVEDLLLSWSLGGYPSPNLRVAHLLCRRPAPPAGQVLDQVAAEWFGPGAADARRAWSAFSESFRQYPFHVDVVYFSPVQIGPANLLYAEATGYRATMTGIPYDDVERWRGPYPAETCAAQFELIAAGWSDGLAHLERAVEAAPPRQRAEANEQLLFARAAALHFHSVGQQFRFTLLRDQLSVEADQARCRSLRKQMDEVVAHEIAAARELFDIACRHACVGFEAANQYFYLPVDLLEKIVCCEHIRNSLRTSF